MKKQTKISVKQKAKNLTLAKAMEKFMIKNYAKADTRIYFNGIAWNYDSDGKKTILDDMLGSDYTEYANDDTLTITTEGELNSIVNMYDYKKHDELIEVFDKYGYYFELGNSWNFSLYKN